MAKDSKDNGNTAGAPVSAPVVAAPVASSSIAQPAKEKQPQRKLKLADGEFWPVVKTVRDKETGKVFDYVARGRFIEAGVANPETGIVERKRMWKEILHKVPRTVKPVEVSETDRYEEVVE